MRQKEYAFGQVKRRSKQLWRKLMRTLLLDDDLVVLVVTQKFERTNNDLRRVFRLRRAGKATYFNLNIFSFQHCLKMFRFKVHELKKTPSSHFVERLYSSQTLLLWSFDGGVLHYKYTSLVTSEMGRFGVCLWHDKPGYVGNVLGSITKLQTYLRFSVWDTMSWYTAVKVRGVLAIFGSGRAPLTNGFGFMDGTKIIMCILGSPNVNQR